uniref:Alpha/beta-hydrolase n=1 Tax=Loa loa TaxID=7209 RepID=A0A1I7VJA2_LOALO
MAKNDPQEGPVPLETSVFYTTYQRDYLPAVCDTVPIATVATYPRSKVSVLQPTTLLIHGNEGHGTLPLIDGKSNDDGTFLNGIPQQSTKSLVKHRIT